MHIRAAAPLLAVLAVLAVLAAPADAQRTARRQLPRFLIVDAAGGPDADHTSLQKAVDAAAEGAQILVRDGYYGPVEVAAKSLHIVADEPRLAFAAGLTVRDLAAPQSVTVRGLRFARAEPGRTGPSSRSGAARGACGSRRSTSAISS